MAEPERYDALIIGSGEAGQHIGWTMAQLGHRTAVIERKLVGGSCPNIACLPSKNIIRSAKVASFAHRAQEFGLEIGSPTTNMAGVQRRKQKMVADLIQVHLDRYKASGAELIMGTAHDQFCPRGFVAVEMNLNQVGNHFLLATLHARHVGRGRSYFESKLLCAMGKGRDFGTANDVLAGQARDVGAGATNQLALDDG